MGDARRDADVAALTRSLAGEAVGTYVPETRRPYTTHEVTRGLLGGWVLRSVRCAAASGRRLAAGC